MLRLTVPSRREKQAILNFLRSLKTQSRRVVPTDTTDYLMSNPVNRERLLQAIRDVESGLNLVHHDLIEL